MISKAIVFCVAYLAIWTTLMTWRPAEFVDISLNQQFSSKEAKAAFDAADVLCYNNSVACIFNYSDPASATTFPFGLPAGEYLEVDWTIPVRYSSQLIYFRHLWHGLWGYWYDYHNLDIYTVDGVKLPYGDKIFRQDMIDNFDAAKNCTIFAMRDPLGHIKSNVIFKVHNSSFTIAQSWDAGQLQMYLSYNVDYTASGMSAWGLLAQIMSYILPDLGIGGIGGIIINTIIAFPIIACLSYLAFVLITALIPFIPGVGGD